MDLYSQKRLDDVDDPWERLVCAVIMQAVLDWRIPGMKFEVSKFFHGPLCEAVGIDGDLLVEMAINATGGRA